MNEIRVRRSTRVLTIRRQTRTKHITDSGLDIVDVDYYQFTTHNIKMLIKFPNKSNFFRLHVRSGVAVNSAANVISPIVVGLIEMRRGNYG